jgi:DNA-binding response OmpR family regulator
LVLLDLNLPDGSGFDVLAAVRADPLMARVPVFILSADATEQATTRARELGADRFITKPFNLKAFVALVEAAT